MPGLKTTTDKIRLVTSSASGIDVSTEYTDLEFFASGGTQKAVPGTQNTKISTATTTTIVDAPALSTTFRRLEEATLRNIHSSLSCDVTVYLEQTGPVNYEIIKVTLRAGETLQYKDGSVWYVLANVPAPLLNESVASQTGFAVDTYLAGSSVAVPSGVPIVGTMYKLLFDVTKTNVGTATPIITVRFGTAGAIGDAARCTFTFGAGTAAVDAGVFECLCLFRTVGSGTTAVIQGVARLTSNLTVTGLSNAVKAPLNTGGGFDSTVAASFIGASYNGGASAAHTIQLVRAELVV